MTTPHDEHAFDLHPRLVGKLIELRPPRAGDFAALYAVAADRSLEPGSSNRQVVELLFKRGAVPDDHDPYLAGFAHDRHQLLPMLIAQTPSLAEIAEQALAAPISNSDVASARLLLEAGANPNRYRIDAGHPTSVLWAALEAGCEGEFLELLLDHRADPNAAASEGRTTASLRQHVASRPAIIRLREQLAAARVRRVFAAAFVALGARLAVTARS